MNRLATNLVASIIAVAMPALATPSSAADKAGISPVGRMLHVLGGYDVPYRVESIAFTFAVERDGKVAGSRRHIWHPQSGRHQLRYERDEAVVMIDWNLHTKSGSATRTGVPAEGKDLLELLDGAGKMWINDYYWLLMPYKLIDPGVQLEWDGEVIIEGRAFDKVKATFGDNIGLTPGDTYWAFIARDNGTMERWSFVLEGREPPPSEWDWQNSSYYGPLLLATRKQRVGSDMAILTHDIVVR